MVIMEFIWPFIFCYRLLWSITAPIVLLLGTIGNMAIILVMSRKSLRRTAFAHYLIAIAVCDLIAIWVALVRHFIKNAFQVSKPNSWHQPLLRNDYMISCMHMHAAVALSCILISLLRSRGVAESWDLRLIS